MTPDVDRPVTPTLTPGTAGVTVDEFAAAVAEQFSADLQNVRVQEPDTVVADLSRENVKQVAHRLHDLEGTPVDSLTLISSVDYRTHLECVYHLYSYAANLYLELHVRLPRTGASVDTVSDVWPSADWHEREAWDMMGIKFKGHPDPRRILLKDDWIGHPLRKDYVDDIRNHPYV